MNLRLQSIVYKAGLAKTANQARQLIVHGHISVNGQKVTVPSYLVMQSERGKINYNPKSAFNKEDHPERPKVEASLGKSLQGERKNSGKINKEEKKEESHKEEKPKKTFEKKEDKEASLKKNLQEEKTKKEKPAKKEEAKK